MLISALLEAWTINDGNYPDMAVGMLVNLAFEMSALTLDATGDVDEYKHLGEARYHFHGSVMQRYDDPEALIVVSAGKLRFFSEGATIAPLHPGNRISGEGILVVDYYTWSENISDRQHAIDISYNLMVERIRRLPTTLPGTNSEPSRTETPLSRAVLGEVLDKTAASHDRAAEYLMDFRVVDRSVTPTFLS